MLNGVLNLYKLILEEGSGSNTTFKKRDKIIYIILSMGAYPEPFNLTSKRFYLRSMVEYAPPQ